MTINVSVMSEFTILTGTHHIFGDAELCAIVECLVMTGVANA